MSTCRGPSWWKPPITSRPRTQLSFAASASGRAVPRQLEHARAALTARQPQDARDDRGVVGPELDRLDSAHLARQLEQYGRCEIAITRAPARAASCTSSAPRKPTPITATVWPASILQRRQVFIAQPSASAVTAPAPAARLGAHRVDAIGRPLPRRGPGRRLGEPGVEVDHRLIAEDAAGQRDVGRAVADVAHPVLVGDLRLASPCPAPRAMPLGDVVDRASPGRCRC